MSSTISHQSPSEQTGKAGRPAWQVLLGILILGIAVRCVVYCCFDFSRLYIEDEQDYNELAMSLEESGLYAIQGELTSIRPPLWPWVLSHLCGPEGFDGQGRARLLAELFQLGVLILATLGVYGLARELDGIVYRRGAYLAAAVFFLYPSFVGETFLQLTEPLFTLFLVLVLWTAVRFFRTGSLWAISFCGVFIALGALTRSILWMSPIPFALFILLFANGSWKRRAAAAGLLVLFAGCVMAPWMVRNTRLQKTLTAIDCMSGRNLMMGNYEYTPLYRAWVHVSDPQKYWNKVLEKDYFEQHHEVMWLENTQGQVDKLAGDYAKRYILAHPGQTLQRDCVKALCFWQLERSLPAGVYNGFWGWENTSPTTRRNGMLAVNALIQPVYCFLFLSAIFGVFSVFRRGPENLQRNVILGFLLCVVVYFWSIHALIFAHERYHLPVVPIMILFAILFWQNRHENILLMRRSPLGGLACVIALAFVFFWCAEILIMAKVW